MIAIFAFIFAVCAQIAVLADQYAALQRFMSEGMGRTLFFDPTACPTNVAPPNGRVACDSKGRITQLYLTRASLTGNLTTTIAALTDLVHLNLSDNLLVGGLSNLAALTNLETLDLSYNALVGDALAVVETLPYLRRCVLQTPTPRDTNCFPGRLEWNASVCNEARLSPLNLCRTYIERVAVPSSPAPSTTTAPLSSATASVAAASVSESTSEQRSQTAGSEPSPATTLPSDRTTVPKTAEVQAQTSPSELAANPLVNASLSSENANQYLAVVVLGVAVALLYIAIVGYVIFARLRKRQKSARKGALSSNPLQLAADILEVADIASNDNEPSSTTDEPEEVRGGGGERPAPIYDRFPPGLQPRGALAKDGEYGNLPVVSADVPSAVFNTMRQRKAAAAAAAAAAAGSDRLLLPPPPAAGYSQLPPPITSRTESASSNNGTCNITVARARGEYDSVAPFSAKTVYDRPESGFG